MYGTFFIQLTCSTLNLGDIVKNIIITPFAKGFALAIAANSDIILFV